MKSARVRRRRPAEPDAPHDVPALPASKAFVVQFSRETGSESGAFAGRVEHIDSGRRSRFASSAGLLTALTRMIDQLVCTCTEKKRK